MVTSAVGTATPAVTPVTLDDTVGGADSNSFTNRDVATECLMPFPQYEQWFDLPPQQQDYNLITATFYLETRYRWYGKIFSPTQSLQWPRTIVYDRDGREYPAGVMPKELIKATSFLAAEFAITNLLETSAKVSGSIQRVESGNVEVELKPPDVDDMLGKRFPWIENLLASIGTILDSGQRDVKVQFARGFMAP